MSLELLSSARRSTYPASAKLHGGSINLAGSGKYKKMKGAGFMDFIRSAGNWLKKSKILSTIGGVVGSVFKPVAPVAMGLRMAGLGRYHRRIRTYKRRTGQVRKHTRRMIHKCNCG